MASSDPGSASRVAQRFWLRLGVFVFGLLLGWGLLEWVLVTSANSMSLKRDRLNAAAANVDTLILGSSETYYGLKPTALSGYAYNLASNAQTVYYDYELTRKFLPAMPHLRRAYLLVNYMTLYTELYDHPDSFRQYGYLQEFGIPLQRKRDYFDLRTVSRVLLHGPHAAIEDALNGFASPRNNRIDARGWYRVPDEDRWGLSLEDAAGRLAVHHGFMRKQYMQDNIEALKRLIELLQAHHVSVVLITTPVFRTYREQMRADFWEPARGTYAQLANDFGIPYLDFLQDPRFHEADFEDTDHLNADGAEHFARILDMAVGGIDASSSSTDSVTSSR